MVRVRVGVGVEVRVRVKVFSICQYSVLGSDFVVRIRISE